MLTSEDEEMQGIRVRGTHVSRLEGLTDAVIGFAVTLLIVSMEVPRSLDEMFAMVLGFPAFGITFLLLLAIWYWHYRFFRQYGLNTKSVIWANGVLLFVVLLFVYPLKFLATIVINHVFLEGWFGIDMPNLLSFRPGQYAPLHALYAVGFASVFICFSWLYKIALNAKDELELSEIEIFHTRTHMVLFTIVAVVPLLTILVLFLPTPYAPMYAGFGNMLIWPATWWYGSHAKRQLLALEEKLEPGNA
jgi:uncharacterized membrane protein